MHMMLAVLQKIEYTSIGSTYLNAFNGSILEIKQETRLLR